jgi:hypothetical protein
MSEVTTRQLNQQRKLRSHFHFFGQMPSTDAVRLQFLHIPQKLIIHNFLQNSVISPNQANSAQTEVIITLPVSYYTCYVILKLLMMTTTMMMIMMMYI